MDLSALALRALRPTYTVVRLPFQVAEQALGHVVAAGDEPRATLTRVIGTADQLVGMVLEDDALVQRGARLRESADSSRHEDSWSGAGSPAGPPPADPAPSMRPEADAPAAAQEEAQEPAREPAPEPEPDPAEVAAALQAEQLREQAAAALAEVDLTPAAPGDEHHLVGHHVDATPGVDKAAFAEEQRRKADAEMAEQEAARRAREHGAS